MTSENSYLIALFYSTSGALMAEKLFKREGIPHKIIPVPRHISSDCGVCLRFSASERERAEATLAGKVDIQDMCLM
jgi:hypothetical protein